MSNNVLFVGIDGWDIRLADYYNHEFWQKIRDESTVAKIDKPDGTTDGKVATASSPRLWARIYTGCPPKKNGVLGFWEKVDPDTGKVLRAFDEKSTNEVRQWIRENRCEKTVMADDLLVPPIWEVIAKNELSIGLTSPWFTYPLSDRLKEAIDDVGHWALTDFPFPMDHRFMDRNRMVHPDEVWPGEDFVEEVGNGMRILEMIKDNPEQVYDDLLQADADRYDHCTKQLERFDTPDFCTVLTRQTDMMAHKFRTNEDIMPHYPKRISNGRENFRRIYSINFDGIQRLWETGNFDHLVIGGDHGTTIEFDNGEPIFPNGSNDHHWPTHFLFYSDDFPNTTTIRATYEDVTPTILDVLGIEPPKYIEGQTIRGQAQVESRLSDLGYVP